jgi:iron(III) transport system ATP-binding protein
VPTLRIENISKDFGGKRVLSGISFEVDPGEFISVLGPSGCGKTTLLRIIAGFEEPTEGRVFFDGRDITSVTPRERGIGMVFQNYALFPHMTVRGNVMFGLEVQRTQEEEAQERVQAILRAVNMEHLTDMPVTRLSGGEQQRVAVSRALVVEPQLLLFDEPLSNLDVALRAKTRDELKALQTRTQIAAVYVTHDQAEALALSDRVVVLKDGQLQQVGSPREIYERPASPFVASFIGDASLLFGTVASERVDFGGFQGILPPGFTLPEGTRLIVAVKPEHIVPVSNMAPESLEARVDSVAYQGFTTHLGLLIGDSRLQATCVTSALAKDTEVGTRLAVSIQWERCHFFPDG